MIKRLFNHSLLSIGLVAVLLIGSAQPSFAHQRNKLGVGEILGIVGTSILLQEVTGGHASIGIYSGSSGYSGGYYQSSPYGGLYGDPFGSTFGNSYQQRNCRPNGSYYQGGGYGNQYPGYQNGYGNPSGYQTNPYGTYPGQYYQGSPNGVNYYNPYRQPNYQPRNQQRYHQQPCQPRCRPGCRHRH